MDDFRSALSLSLSPISISTLCVSVRVMLMDGWMDGWMDGCCVCILVASRSSYNTQ